MWVLGQEKLSVFLWSQLVFDAKWISFFFEVFQPITHTHADSTAPGDIRVRTVMLLGANEHISHHI